MEECSELRDQPAATRWRQELPPVPELFQVDGREEDLWMGGKCEIDGGREFIEYWIDRNRKWGIFSSPPSFPLLCVCAFAEVGVIHASAPAVVARSLEKLEIWDRYHPASILPIPIVKICHRHSVVLRGEKKEKKICTDGDEDLRVYCQARGKFSIRTLAANFSRVDV